MSEGSEKKPAATALENVATNERVPGHHDAYYEKGGLRTYGDDMDHDHEPPVGLSIIYHSTTEAYTSTVDIQTLHVLGCHGLSLGGFPDPFVYLRRHPSLDLR